LMGALLVIVSQVLTDNVEQVFLAQEREVPQTLPFDALDKSLRVGMRFGARGPTVLLAVILAKEKLEMGAGIRCFLTWGQTPERRTYVRPIPDSRAIQRPCGLPPASGCRHAAHGS
jgi:hypothetical protein